MSVQNPIITYFEQLLQSLVILLSGFGHEFTPMESGFHGEVAEALDAAEQTTYLVLVESKGGVKNEDLSLLFDRLAQLQMTGWVVERRDAYLLVQVEGPRLGEKLVRRVFASDEFVVGAMLADESWQEAVPEAVWMQQGALRGTFAQSSRETWVAASPDAFSQPIKILQEKGYRPFVHCKGSWSNQMGYLRRCMIDVLDPSNLITGEMLTSARVAFDEISNYPKLDVTLNDEGKRKFENLTRYHMGQPLPIVMGEEGLSMPRVQGVVDGGKFTMTLGGAEDWSDTLYEAASYAAVLSGPAYSAKWTVLRVASPHDDEDAAR